MRLSCEDLAELADALTATSYRSLRVEAEGFSALLTHDGLGWRAEVTELGDVEVGKDSDAGPDETAVRGPCIRAPLVGTFYRSPKPGAPPFVDVGSRVSPDTVVGIIETMKLMNSVHAGLDGVVAEIAVSDAQFVENGQILMRIEEGAA